MTKNKITLKRNDIIDLIERREERKLQLLIVEYDTKQREILKESIKDLQFLKAFIKDAKNNDEIVNFILKI